MLISIAFVMIAVWNTFMLFYFLALNASYTVLFFLGRAEVWRYVRRRALRNYAAIAESEMSLAVSVLMPAYNEGPVIVDSVTAMLDLHYANMEVLVINDGSKDETLDELKRAFNLVAVDRVPRAGLSSAEVRAVYFCPHDPRLVVVDKHNGGKADSLNAGLNFARYPLFCAVDADTLLEREALPRLVWQFQNFPETVAVGGIVRIVNGCTVEGRGGHRRPLPEVADRAPADRRVPARVPHRPHRLVASQRPADHLRCLRPVPARARGWPSAGYATDTVGEDAELVVRLHRHCYENAIPHRAAFIADPVCWTQAPSDWHVLGRQRDRWQRGLAETLWRHRTMMFNPRYGIIGMLVLPFFLLFEAAGPIIELGGYVVLVASALLGITSVKFVLLMSFLAFGYGLLFSLGALYVEERSFQRYYRLSDLMSLLVAALIDNFGFRQWHAFIRAKSYITLLRGNASWGEMTRTAFVPAAPVVAEDGPPGRRRADPRRGLSLRRHRGHSGGRPPRGSSPVGPFGGCGV